MNVASIVFVTLSSVCGTWRDGLRFRGLWAKGCTMLRCLILLLTLAQLALAPAARETLIESLYNNNADALRNLSNAYAGIELENALVNLDILLSTELSDPGITPERAALVEEMRSNSDALLAALNAEPGATSTAMVAGMADALLEMGIEVSGSALDLAWNNVTDGEMGLSEFTSEAILISTALAVVTGVKLSRIWKNGLDRSFQNPWLDQNGSVPNFRDEFVIDPKKFEYIFGGVT